MKMPDFASLSHCGCWYLMSEAQSGRKGPSFAWCSASATRRLRSTSYLLTDCCHSWSISAADLTPSVGASGSVEAAGDWATRRDAAAKGSRARQRRKFCIGRHRKLLRHGAANAFIACLKFLLRSALDIFLYGNVLFSTWHERRLLP